MSGNVALRTLVVDQNIQAAVIWAGAVFSYEDRTKYGINDNSFVRRRSDEQGILSRSRSIIEEYGDYSSSSPFWQSMPPLNYLDGISTAIQVHHAENDTVVNVQYSRDLISALEKTNLPHDAQYYANGGHDIEGASFTSAMNATIDFFTQHLQ